MCRPPPSHPWFPYTTLFRSLAHQIDDRVDDVDEGRLAAAQEPGVTHRPAHDPAQHVAAPLVGREDPVRQDRKSTRLNSSHVRISYAVFCLKKKETYVAISSV